MLSVSALDVVLRDILAEWGGWGWSGGQQGIVLLGEGYEFSDQEATSGSSYQEYKVKSVNVSRVNYDYECCPSEV